MFKKGIILVLLFLLGFSGVQIHFLQKESDLMVHNEEKENFDVHLMTRSETTIPASRRQDIALLFVNGRLVRPLSETRTDTAYVHQEYSLAGEESARYDLITFHYAEMDKQNGEPIRQHSLSRDQIYILSSAIAFDPEFRKPSTNTQTQWKRILDRDIERHWKSLTDYFRLSEEDFEFIPLLELPQYEEVPLPFFSDKETKAAIRQIWSQLHNKYILGHVDYREKPLDPVGSLMPLIAVAHDGTHFHILYRTKGGKSLQIMQPLDG